MPGLRKKELRAGSKAKRDALTAERTLKPRSLAFSDQVKADRLGRSAVIKGHNYDEVAEEIFE